MEKAIVLTADYAYVPSVLALIKSVVYHNRDVHFYLINSDVPEEWFEGLNAHLQPFNSQITDIKLDPQTLANSVIYHEHINKMSFGWFVMTKYVTADVVLYLDSDIIVNDKLDDLFNIDFGDHYLWAAAPELWNKQTFNSGVLVANNRRLRQIPDLVDQLLKESTDSHLINGDQEVFNKHFAGQIKALPMEDNYQIGDDKEAFWRQMTGMQDDLNQVKQPRIIHYVGDDKPTELTSAGRLRNMWWYYANLEFADIRSRWGQPVTVTNRLAKGNDILIFTNSAAIEQIDQLVRALPDCHFHIVAWTWMAFSLVQLMQYGNVRVYPQAIGAQLNQLVNDCRLYLDINHGPKDEDVIRQFASKGKPILAFDDTKKENAEWPYQAVVPTGNVQQMVQAIKNGVKLS